MPSLSNASLPVQLRPRPCPASARQLGALAQPQQRLSAGATASTPLPSVGPPAGCTCPAPATPLCRCNCVHALAQRRPASLVSSSLFTCWHLHKLLLFYVPCTVFLLTAPFQFPAPFLFYLFPHRSLRFFLLQLFQSSLQPQHNENASPSTKLNH
jgi:hypothetical protein